MPTLIDANLRDPSPPIPGREERAAVANRAHQLGRRRRMMQGAGALGMIAAVAVSVAALTAGGTSDAGRRHIGAANSAGTNATVDTPAVTAVPAPVPRGSDAGEVAAASTFTVAGTVANIPAFVTVTLTLTGTEGTFSAVADGAGNFSVNGIPTGTYNASYEWIDSTGSATQAGQLGPVTVGGDATVSFALP